MAQYDFEIKHRPGKQMAHVDFLSRKSTPEPEPSTSTINHFDTLPNIPDAFLDKIVEQEIAINNSKWEFVSFSCQG